MDAPGPPLQTRRAPPNRHPHPSAYRCLSGPCTPASAAAGWRPFGDICAPNLASLHRNTDKLLTVADMTLNQSTLQVHRAGRRVELNPAGIKLLRRLMEQSPSVVDRHELETLLWADERPDGDALRSHMYKLRQAVDRPFDRPLIHTIHRIGYRIAEDAR